MNSYIILLTNKSLTKRNFAVATNLDKANELIKVYKKDNRFDHISLYRLVEVDFK